MSADWDAAVVGAGPAGALAAHALAKVGARVILIDKAAFPRFKVCGCCLNADALATLESAGMGPTVAGLGGEPLERLTLAGEGRRATLALPRGYAISRARLDNALADAAVNSGVCLRERTAALGAEPTPAGYRLALRSGGARTTVNARTVLVADGLAGGFLRSLDGFQTRTAAAARIGLATLVPAADEYAPGAIHMGCGRAGYCGVVRVEQGQLAVAAAVEPAFVRRCGGAGAAACQLLAEAELPQPPLKGVGWKGTPELTREVQPKAFAGMYLAGDAAGYVEPFTGEGMAWALASGARFAEFAEAALTAGETPDACAWERLQRGLLARRQRRCRRITRWLRRPAITRVAIGCAARWPALGSALAHPIAGRTRRSPLH